MKNTTYWKAKHAASELGSPIKYGQANRDVIMAQRELTGVETRYRAPGWAKAAGAIVDSSKKPFASKYKYDDDVTTTDDTTADDDSSTKKETTTEVDTNLEDETKVETSN